MEFTSVEWGHPATQGPEIIQGRSQAELRSAVDKLVLFVANGQPDGTEWGVTPVFNAQLSSAHYRDEGYTTNQYRFKGIYMNSQCLQSCWNLEIFYLQADMPTFSFQTREQVEFSIDVLFDELYYY